MNELYVVLAIACNDCQSRAIAVFNHNPSEEEIKKVKDEGGGMYCISMFVEKVKLNEPLSFSSEIN